MIRHDLPGEGPHTAWFERLNAFEQSETRRQVRFKRECLGIDEYGPLPTHPEHYYPHILPAAADYRATLYGAIADAAAAYCTSEDIALHIQFLNLRSSQVCCLNVMFPLKQNLELAAAALGPLLPGVERVTGIEFEWTGPPEVVQALGEPAGGKRGQNRTSIDCAIWWHDGKSERMTLAEWKYTERTFGGCGGYISKGNTNQQACLDLVASSPDAPSMCYLVRAHDRHYWQLMGDAGINLDILAKVKGCPFRGPFYQLMCQYVLAACVRRLSPRVQVDVACVSFRKNSAILAMPPELQLLGGSVLEAWNAVVETSKRLRHVCAEDIVEAARCTAQSPETRDWVGYLNRRYGI